MLAITTDYMKDTGNPEPYLRKIAETGFSHIHWCHQWCTDFIYSQSEIDQIADWCANYKLQVLDIHASHGREKRWGAHQEYVRLAGVELIENRIHMANCLGSDVIVLHLPKILPSRECLTPIRKSLDELAPFANRCGVRIALENMANDTFEHINQVFSHYDPNFIGLCYDSGHGNILEAHGLTHLENLKHRLIAMHLHDNDGEGDQHNLLFSGTIDWSRLAKIIAESSYKKCISMEVNTGNTKCTDETTFLQQALQTGQTFSRMVVEH